MFEWIDSFKVELSIAQDNALDIMGKSEINDVYLLTQSTTNHFSVCLTRTIMMKLLNQII